MGPSSGKVISGKVFELATMLRIWNRVPSGAPCHSIIKVKNATIDVHLGYGCYRQVVRQPFLDFRHIVAHMNHNRLLRFPIEGRRCGVLFSSQGSTGSSLVGVNGRHLAEVNLCPDAG